MTSGDRSDRFSALIWLSGAERSVLRQCPTERAKFQGIGAAVLVTSGMATVSMGFALSTAVKAPLPLAILFAALWGLAIMMLDRWLVTTIQRQEKKRHSFAVALPRVAFALLIGIVISTPLVLQIFKSEIDVQLERMKASAADANARAAATGGLGKQIAELDAEKKRLEKVIASGGDPGTDQGDDPTLAGLREQEADALKRVADAREELMCELSGRGECNAGDGPLAGERRQQLDTAEQQLARIREQITARQEVLEQQTGTARQENVAAARDRLPRVSEQLAAAQEQRERLTAGFASTNAESDGLLLRLKALHELAGDDLTLLIAYALLSLLFMALECLPVFVKLLLVLVPKRSLYEEVLEAEEQRQRRVAEERARREQNAQILAAEDIISQARLLREARDAAIPRLVDQTVRAEMEVAEAVLNEWRNREMRNVPDNLDAHIAADSFPQPGAQPYPAAGRPHPPGPFPNGNGIPPHGPSPAGPPPYGSGTPQG